MAPDYAERDRKRNEAALRRAAGNDLPPTSTLLLEAFELAAALDANDRSRAVRAAAVLSRHASTIFEVIYEDGDEIVQVQP